ncbi:PAS domain-containing sensor histidine kinase [Sorangium sp. So ce296]|uniref:PAS domain-containing sensor histidine kinase n=1 Tax=Sorangium sp. So ce296 TaxID=3133296 RepID=UPI003F5E3DE8
MADADVDLARQHRPAVERSRLPSVLTATEQHLVFYANPAFCGLSALSLGELSGVPLTDLFRQAEGLARLLDRVIRDGVTDVAVDIAFASSGGSAFHGTAIAAPLLDEQARPRGLLVQILDTTEQAAARAQEAELERRREQVLSRITHDLRSPLTAAMFYAESLELARAEHDTKRLAGRIVRSLRRMDEMIRVLREVQRLQAGHRLPLSLGACDLAAIAREVADDLSAFHDQRLVVQGEACVRGVWSEEELRRAIGILVSNALQHGAEGAPVAITVEAAAGLAVVAVHNEGPAIPPDGQARVFAPFFRAGASEAAPRGWGLGLAFLRGCAEAHGGTVRLESDAERGTTFALELPLDASPYQDPQDPG